MSEFSRRDFLKISTTLGAGFLLGACSGCSRYAIFAPGEGLGKAPGDAEARMLGWLAIQSDGTIRVALTGHTGQSFGFTLMKGVRFDVHGDANDGCGKVSVKVRVRVRG